VEFANFRVVHVRGAVGTVSELGARPEAPEPVAAERQLAERAANCGSSGSAAARARRPPTTLAVARSQSRCRSRSLGSRKTCHRTLRPDAKFGDRARAMALAARMSRYRPVTNAGIGNWSRS
jgi:hypothetical protein